jgi:hypothetical protein
MAHFNGDSAKLSAALAIVEEAPHFGFHSGGKDISHDATFHMDGAIDGGHVRDGHGRFGAEEKISPVSAACAGFGQIGGIAVKM